MLDAHQWGTPVHEYTDADAGDMRSAAAARRAKFFPVRNLVPFEAVRVLPPPEPEPEPEPEPKPAPIEFIDLPDFLALRQLADDWPGAKPTSKMIVREIVRMIATANNLAISDLISPSRMGPVVQARNEAIWLSARDTALSLPSLGRLFGGRDHTTILHSIRRENERRGENLRGAGTAWRKGA